MGMLSGQEIEQDFALMIDLMAAMITAQSQQPADNAPDWLHSLQSLSVKLFKQLYSARLLLEEVAFDIDDAQAPRYIDHSSIAILTRSSFENYLAMTWIFGGGNESLREFRHLVWQYSGWKKRSRMVPTTNDGKRARDNAERDAAALRPKLMASPHFADVNDNAQKQILKGNWDAGWTWTDLAVLAGFHKAYFESVYRYLSGYAHADYISMLQVSQATNLDIQYELGTTSIQACLVVIGHFTNFYADLFPAAKAIYGSAGEAQKRCIKWHLRAEDMNHLYPPS